MNKGKINQLFQSPATYRIPKLVTLVVTSCTLLAMVSLDASASTPSVTTAGTVVSYHVTAPSVSVTNHRSGGEIRSQLSSTTSAPRTSARTHKHADSSAGRSHRSRSNSFKKKTSTKPPTRFVTRGPSRTTTTTQAPTNSTSVLAPAQTTTTTSAPAQTTTTTSAPAQTTTTTTRPPSGPLTSFPVGTPDGSEPSGYAPPSASALTGYGQTYVTDFTGSSLPSTWEAYSGTPGGDPGGQFGGSAHLALSGGVLSLNTFQDPAYGGEWVTGGLCQCGHPQTYGAWFVRSRLTGAGPTGVELLFPTSGWPPEIDFNETGGGITSTTATNIWAATATTRNQVQVAVNIDMTQWHTWGVVWTPTSITYTVDGRAWQSFTNASEIPDQPMTLDLQQQTWCGASPAWACPSTPQSMQVDWVADYASN
jgi:hypothetical protein